MNLDRWKINVFTANVLHRDQFQMTVPNSLRKTTSVEGKDFEEVDNTLLALSVKKNKPQGMSSLPSAKDVFSEVVGWYENTPQRACLPTSGT